MKALKNTLCLLILMVFASCSDKTISEPEQEVLSVSNSKKPISGEAIVDVNGIRQVIDGFGGSTAWSGAMSEDEANALFSNGNNQQLGLSILRVRLDPWKDWADEKSNSLKAKARGAMVLATPWTPPASMKTNNNTIQGSLLPDQYQNYANYLKEACDYFGTIDVMSIQNEPDWLPDYESCGWSANDFLNFAKNNAASIGKPVMMPEALGFNYALSDPVLNDPAASANVPYIGGHIYGVSTPQRYDNAINKGKKVWMTEHYHNGTDISTCMTVAKEIHDCLTLADHNAYIWWTLKIWDCALINNGILNKKGYTIGQFSKFIRPGYNRIDATNNPKTNVYVSAYQGDGKIVVVAINKGTTSVSQSFAVSSGAVNQFTPFRTSPTENLVQLPGINVNNGRFTATLPAQSITTFVKNL
ncbi:glycoside hydrolase family 30 beta sandwich domain-containing protein [Desertivirga brevis]|uniref:glycoside hydrolase family 30 beta sandwich domain-containing protein n=1 Tax=Desertivirga brevis TaxID=2810310 RepID=UPI001A96D39A|nr:glycoside hydrolase family 30 beta sandwich domain-containing protein [Pedobacter sp. SYSU D00873]